MADPSLSAVPAAVLLAALGVASVTDLRRRVIPNGLVAAAALAGLGFATVQGRAGPALLAGGLAAAPFLAASLIRPEGMGMGDVKLAGVLGIFLGQSVWVALALGLGLAGITGVMVSLGRRIPPSRTALPLAPFLALGAGFTLVSGTGLLQ